MNPYEILNKVIPSGFNPYRKKTKEEIDSQKILENEVKKDVLGFSEVAREMFQDERYLKLKNLYTDILKTTMRLIIYYENANLNEYNMKMKEYQIQLRTLMNIFDTPEGFINKAEQILKER